MILGEFREFLLNLEPLETWIWRIPRLYDGICAAYAVCAHFKKRPFECYFYHKSSLRFVYMAFSVEIDQSIQRLKRVSKRPSIPILFTQATISCLKG